MTLISSRGGITNDQMTSNLGSAGSCLNQQCGPVVSEESGRVYREGRQESHSLLEVPGETCRTAFSAGTRVEDRLGRIWTALRREVGRCAAAKRGVPARR